MNLPRDRSFKGCGDHCTEQLGIYLQYEVRRWVEGNFKRAPLGHPLRDQRWRYEAQQYDVADGLADKHCTDDSGGRGPDDHNSPPGNARDVNDWDAKWRDFMKSYRPGVAQPGVEGVDGEEEREGVKSPKEVVPVGGADSDQFDLGGQVDGCKQSGFTVSGSP